MARVQHAFSEMETELIRKLPDHYNYNTMKGNLQDNANYITLKEAMKILDYLTVYQCAGVIGSLCAKGILCRGEDDLQVKGDPLYRVTDKGIRVSYKI